MEGIRFEGLCKAYGGQQVLAGVSGHIAPGERVALRGPSGIGKTTLARILMGLEQADSGTLHGTEGLRCCPVFQEDRLCETFTAAANVALVLEKPQKEGIEAMLAKAGISGEELAKPVRALSGGQKRRVALVRALMAPGGLVILDEAFKGLDDETRARMYRLVLAQLQGRSLLAITHDEAEVAQLCARSIVL